MGTWRESWAIWRNRVESVPHVMGYRTVQRIVDFASRTNAVCECPSSSVSHALAEDLTFSRHARLRPAPQDSRKRQFIFLLACCQDIAVPLARDVYGQLLHDGGAPDTGEAASALRNAVESLRQSGEPFIPSIHMAISVASFVLTNPGTLCM